MRRIVFILLVVSPLAYPAKAADWQHFAFTRKEAYAFDAASIVTVGEAKRVLVRITLRLPKTDGATATIRQLWEFQCVARTMRIAASAGYDRAGRLLRSRSGALLAGHIIPGSSADILRSQVCGGTTPR